ncbi:uncharacterized protein LOC119329332 isoform X4 [Triticum dicoccoides]|uniref:uncharacterized protein LOC119329332 isoform X4 n=1 Tax=Triticum dicoccoides TaxID=85692 RepID=UPI001890F7FE|nr:uncharacterized protein LOC119329332 isoform X4 [Triticum dicoccoides]
MEQVDIWAPILADPLPSQQPEIKVHSTYVDYGTIDFQALLEGPHDLDRWLKGAFIPTYIKEANLTHEIEPTSGHGMKIQTPMPAPPEALLEKEEAPATTTLNGGGGKEAEMREGGGMYPPPCHRRSRRLAATVTPPEEGTGDLLDYIPKSGWRHGSRVRSARERGTWSINIEPCSRDLRSASEGQKHGCRRNNDHWTSEEDKWRNLVKAFTGNVKRRIASKRSRG